MIAAIEVTAPADEGVLTRDALAFVESLHRELNPTRVELLERRHERQRALDAGERPDFLGATRAVREGDWRVAEAPPDLRDRRCETTGPVDRKMMINALNSGARVFMADFEGSCSPTFANVVEGQRNMHDAVLGTISFETAAKTYRLNGEIATLIVRPRGWHLPERHVLVDGDPVSASLFDFGLTMFHNAREQLERGSGPYVYLPKLESHLEARLWAEAFTLAEEELGLERGSIRCTVLIETILAAFEMEEILHELRDFGCSLNARSWDYIFSVIKKLGAVLPDRAQVTTAVPFMRAYTELLVRSCHRRGAHAIGGIGVRAPRSRAGRDGDVRRSARRAAEPARPAARGRARLGRRPARLPRPRRGFTQGGSRAAGCARSSRVSMPATTRRSSSRKWRSPTTSSTS